MSDIFDLIVLGGGPAGYLAAERAGNAGLKTLLIEKRALGGVCLNEGCVPSKTFLQSAKIYDYASGGGEKYGVSTTGATINQKKVIERKNKAVKKLTAGVSIKLKSNKVEVEMGFGTILGKDEEGFKVSVNEKTYAGKKLLVATGSETVIPNITGLDKALETGFVLTNREILDIQEIPKSLIVVGGGVIGIEMAAYFNSVGSEVTVIEMLDNIAGYIDKEISEILKSNYEKQGVKFNLGCKVTSFGKDFVEYKQAGENKKIVSEKCLLSIGRKPVVTGFGLETLNPEMERNVLKTDEYGRTSISGLYGAGDVNGLMMLAHVAYRESEVLINNIIGKKDITRYSAIPSVIYTNPEVACVGLTKEAAQEKGLDVKEIKIPMMYSGRYVAEVEGGDGICKLVIDNSNNCLVGVHMIGSYCSEIIYGAALMIETEMQIDDIKELVFPHPTVSEVIREALFMD